tara:strand:+ start:6271 stop:7629 length:1359 start_codon:yes stop_codon:yes gene_type:complete
MNYVINLQKIDLQKTIKDDYIIVSKMTYNLSSIPRIDELLGDIENRKDIAKSLNLKYNTWKHKNGETYHILKYDKKWLTPDTANSVGLLRSLIFKDDGQIVSFAPPKSLNISGLTTTTHNEQSDDKKYVFEEFVEGTMINVFYEEATSNWEIATRSNVGGTMCFFMENGFKVENTFKYMFDEVCETTGFDVNILDKKYSYSFVLQHPRNRIVKPITEMKLYLTEVYQIEGKNVRIIDINNNLEQFGILGNTVSLVNKQQVHSDDELNGCKQSMLSGTTQYDIVGVIIKSNYGERYKIRNPTYEYVRHLRGNQPKLQYQYIYLRQSGRVSEYLQYYPEHNTSFYEFRNNIHTYTSELFNNYIKCYIKKEKKLTEFPEKFRTHMYSLHHDVYKKILMPEMNYVNKEVVIHYFNGLHPSKQMFVLNYDHRKKENVKHSGIEETKVETVIDVEIAN